MYCYTEGPERSRRKEWRDSDGEEEFVRRDEGCTGGCIKCRSTEHWSRDRPSSSSNPNEPSPNLVATQPLAQWHSQLIPYYSFDQFVRKVEQVGATGRVRRCISELKDKVANGGDPSKLYESLLKKLLQKLNKTANIVLSFTTIDDPTAGEPVADAVDPLFDSIETDHIQEEEIFNEIYHKATEHDLS
ncbi:hypothetical protein ZIOFF_034180 [Zingiber officinale]|uniref:Chromosome segregation in meiosis protein 3 domain-containing protein n=1 Tax=Zingiber officinale TaxID=94328 RepID=A0A8J5GXZ5_ZINOF|nr:hypothetical protein ZIOFF_034180 [Zingiber officinale]